MAKCRNCGSEIPPYAKFCTKCGISQPIDLSQEQATATQSAELPQQSVQDAASTPQPKKPADFTWFNKNFIILFVIAGVSAYALTELGAAYMGLSVGFGITLCVFALIFASAFLAIGILRFVAAYRESGEVRAKTRTRDVICFALSIIGFLFVFLSCIALFCVAGDYIDAMDALGGMLGGMMG